MYKVRCSASRRVSQSYLCKKCFTLGVTVFFVCFSLFLMNISAQITHGQTITTGHGCAPNTPPPVSGTPIPAPATSGSVMINEVLTAPKSVWNCSDPSGDASPSTNSWIELYNTQSQTLDLYASHAEISLDGGTNWYHLPFGSAIAPHEFFVVFPLEGALSPFTWDMILMIGSAVIDQANIPSLLPDQSYARIPDGSANWQLVGEPTIDASNNGSNQPVTATPTKTPKPTETPKPTKATGPSRSPEATLPPNTGTQPVGNLLHIPSATAALSGPAVPVLSQHSPAAASTESNTWYTLTLVSLILLLGGALACCWQLFRTP